MKTGRGLTKRKGDLYASKPGWALSAHICIIIMGIANTNSGRKAERKDRKSLQR